MFNVANFRTIIIVLFVLFVSNYLTGQTGQMEMASLLPVQAAPAEVSVTQLPVNQAISLKDMEKFKDRTVSIKVIEEGKEVNYSGVPLRLVLSEMIPELKMGSKEELKDLCRRELVMEIMGQDGYPALVTATEIAINKEGDRFVLATQKDGKAIGSGLHLICKTDQGRFRWTRDAVNLKIVSLAANPLEAQADAKVSVIYAAKDIPEGAMITADALEQREELRSKIPAGALRDAGKAILKRTLYPITQGSIVLENVIKPDSSEQPSADNVKGSP